MNEENFIRRVPLILFWILPAVGSDLIDALSHHDNLTQEGSLMASMFLTALLLTLWVWSGWSTFRDARSHFIRGAYSSGWVAKFEGRLFLMIPADGDIREAIAKGEKRPEHFVAKGDA